MVLAKWKDMNLIILELIQRISCGKHELVACHVYYVGKWVNFLAYTRPDVKSNDKILFIYETFMYYLCMKH